MYKCYMYKCYMYKCYSMYSPVSGTLCRLATSGPTHEQQPVFQWSTSGFHPTPLGHPDKWDFSPVWVKWNN